MSYISNEEKQKKVSTIVVDVLEKTGLSLAKFGKLFTLPGEKEITRQAVFEWKVGNSKPSTDRLFDIYFHSDSQLAREAARSILIAIWPDLNL